MTKITAILVDDEESARDVLSNLLARFCPEVTLLATCSNVPEAVEKIKEHQPQLVFLDIEMPKYAGYEIVNFFDTISFEMIFVTAYDHHAIRAFEVAAIDYLLKPIDIERLKSSIQRIIKKNKLDNQANNLSVLSQTLKSKLVQNILVSDKGQQVVLGVASIIAIEAKESYAQVYTFDKRYLISKNLKHFETILSENQEFIRTHKSWMINKNHLLNYSKSNFSIALKEGITAKLSKYKKDDFELALLSSSIPK